MNMTSDVTHEILVSLSDFKTLSAAIRVSKRFYDVFQTHPKSIVRAVAANVVGPALPYAARAAHYVDMCVSSDDYAAANAPDEAHFNGLHWELNRNMAATIERYAKAVRKLEAFYSQRYKDRTSPSSVLDATEAYRFARAMYRYIFCHEVVHRGSFLDDPDEDTKSDAGDFYDDEDDDEETERKQIHAGLCEFSRGLPSDELFELMDVSAFAMATRLWQHNAWSHTGYLLDASMSLMDVCYLASRFDDPGAALGPDERRYSDYDLMTEMVKEVLRARKVPEARLAGEPHAAIISSVHGSEDTCSRCQTQRGVELLGTPNMYLLGGLFVNGERARSLPGLLSRNRDECHALAQHFNNIQHTIRDSVLVGTLMDMEPDGEDADGEHWSKDEWYCLDCIKLLFRQRLMLWWRDVKRSRPGEPVQDDCWYGYNCRTMTHRSSHATKLNHLCKPARGDAPAPRH